MLFRSGGDVGLDQLEAQAIAEAVLDLLRDPARRDACGAAARRRVVERYSVGPYLAQLLPVYETAISNGTR